MGPGWGRFEKTEARREGRGAGFQSRSQDCREAAAENQGFSEKKEGSRGPEVWERDMSLSSRPSPLAPRPSPLALSKEPPMVCLWAVPGAGNVLGLGPHFLRPQAGELGCRGPGTKEPYPLGHNH